MGKTLTSLLLLVLSAYAVILAVIYFKQDSMLYYPVREIWQTPENMHLAYSNLELTTKDGVAITGWYVPADNEKGVVLFCHGNAGNISHRLDSIKIFNSLGLSVLIFDYRGYGKSKGKPSERGMYLDAGAAWDYLVKDRQKNPEGIVVFGRSLGGAVAAEIALKNSPGVLIIESSFTSVPDLGRKLYPWLPVRLLSKFRYSTVDKIGLIKSPKLIIHSPDDEIVPFKQGKVLYERALPPKEFLELEGGHNDGFVISGKKYTDGLKNFLEKYFIRK